MSRLGRECARGRVRARQNPRGHTVVWGRGKERQRQGCWETMQWQTVAFVHGEENARFLSTRWSLPAKINSSVIAWISLFTRPKWASSFSSTSLSKLLHMCDQTGWVDRTNEFDSLWGKYTWQYTPMTGESNTTGILHKGMWSLNAYRICMHGSWINNQFCYAWAGLLAKDCLSPGSLAPR